MARIHIYRTYRWINKDPVIDAIKTVVKSDEHLKNSQVHAISGVSTATLDNWFDGTTKKPQNSTICAVTSALGYVRHDYFDRNGNVQPRFVKANDKINYQEEMIKQADFMLRQNKKSEKTAARKRQTKVNGHAKTGKHNP